MTLLGIILATATLIAVMGVIHGMDVYIAQQVSDMGASGFRVRRIGTGPGGAQTLAGASRRTRRSRAKSTSFCAQMRFTSEIGMETGRSAPLRYGGENLKDVRLQGYTPNMAAISNIQTDAGRFFLDGENNRRAAVVVIGNDIREKFFPGVDPVGKPLPLAACRLWWWAPKKLGSVFGQSRDNFV